MLLLLNLSPAKHATGGCQDSCTGGFAIALGATMRKRPPSYSYQIGRNVIGRFFGVVIIIAVVYRVLDWVIGLF